MDQELVDSGQHVDSAPKVPPTRPCPRDTYKSLSVVWTCAGHKAGTQITVPARATERAMVLPAAVRNLRLRVWNREQARIDLRSLSGDLLVRAAGGKALSTLGLVDGAAAGVVSDFDRRGRLQGHGVTATYSGRVGDETVVLEGTLANPLVLYVDNLDGARDAASIVLVSYEGIDHCHEDTAPGGCLGYVEPVARQYAQEWFCSGKLPLDDSSWALLRQNHLEAHGGTLAVPWHQFADVWETFSLHGVLKGIGKEHWKPVFRFLDQDGDLYLTKAEFDYGIGQCPRGVDLWGPTPLMAKLSAIVLCAAAVLGAAGIAGYCCMATHHDWRMNRPEGFHKGEDWVPASEVEEAMALKAAADRPRVQPSKACVQHGRGVLHKMRDVLTCAGMRKARREQPPPPPPPPPAGGGLWEALPSWPRARPPEPSGVQQGAIHRAARELEGAGNAEEALDAVGRLTACVDQAGASRSESDTDGRLAAARAAVEAMRDHEAVQPVVAACCHCLASIAVCDAAQVSASGGLNALVGAMRGYSMSEEVQEAALGCATYLAASPHGRDALLRADGASLAVTAMQTHGSSPGVQEYGCVVLNYLSLALEAPTKIGSDAMEAVVEAINRHQDAEGVQEAGVAALFSIDDAVQDDNMLAASRAKEVAEDAMRRHPHLFASAGAAGEPSGATLESDGHYGSGGEARALALSPR